MKTKVSIVIPCYNSSLTLRDVVGEIQMAFVNREDYSCELVLVNDASIDNTIDVINGLCEENSNIIGIDLAKNRGQHAAIMAGMAYSSGEFVFSIDDDGQTPGDSIFTMLREIEKGYDVVCGRFVKRPKRSVIRRFGTWVNTSVRNWLLDVPKGIYLSIFFVARRFVVDEILKYKNPYPYMAGLILRTTDNIGSIDVVQKERLASSSGYTFSKLFSLWLNGFTAFSIKPLRVSTFIGLISAAVGLIVALIIVINKIIDPSYVAGWVSTVASSLVLNGIILFMLGLVGEYIGRIYISINESPLYVVRKVIKKKV